MEEEKYTVYRHLNKINRKSYIGITCRKPEIRWGKNGSGYLRKNKKGQWNQPKFAPAILKYGWDNFEHIIVAERLSEKEAGQMEYDLIIQYNTLGEDGYNSTYGGIYHRKTEEEKEKISKANKKFYETHDGYKKGKHLSEQEKQHLSNIFKRRKFSDETKQKMSKNHYDVNNEKNPRARSVRCIETNEVFSCAKEAGLIYNNVPSNPRCGIRDCCRGRRKTSGVHPETKQPLHWEWAE